MGVQFLAMLILARKLSPHDFATMGIISFFIVISQVLTDAGMGGSLLKKENVTDIDYSTLFIFNISVASFIYIVIFLLSGVISLFYGISDLATYINVAMLSVIISAFGQVQNIILYKDLKFKTISLISIFSSIIALLVSVVLAEFGLGVWALVFQNIVLQFLIVLLQFINNKYFPKLQFSLDSLKYQWNFGIYLCLSQLLNSIYQNVFSMVFPKISSMTFSGYYTQANKIQSFPTSIVVSVYNSVAFPVLTKCSSKTEFFSLNNVFSKQIYFYSFIVIFSLILFPKEIITLTLGEKWIDVSLILQILSFGSISLLIMNINRTLFKALAYTNWIFYIEIIKVIISILAVLIALLCSDNSYIVLLSIVIAQYVTLFVSSFILSFKTNYTIFMQYTDILKSTYPILLASIIVAFCQYFFSSNFFVFFLIYIFSILFIDIFTTRILFSTIVKCYNKL